MPRGDTRLRDRLRRLLALAERGEAGEKENAGRVLERLLAKHGLTVEDLADDEASTYSITYRTADERQLLVQVICKVMCLPSFENRFRNNKVRTFTIQCSRAEYVEIVTSFDVYARALRLEQERLLHAFIIRNQIYPPEGVTDGQKNRGDDLDLREILRRVRIAQNLDPTQVHRQLVDPNRRALGAGQ